MKVTWLDTVMKNVQLTTVHLTEWVNFCVEGNEEWVDDYDMEIRNAWRPYFCPHHTDGENDESVCMFLFVPMMDSVQVVSATFVSVYNGVVIIFIAGHME